MCFNINIYNKIKKFFRNFTNFIFFSCPVSSAVYIVLPGNESTKPLMGKNFIRIN